MRVFYQNVNKVLERKFTLAKVNKILVLPVLVLITLYLSQ